MEETKELFKHSELELIKWNLFTIKQIRDYLHYYENNFLITENIPGTMYIYPYEKVFFKYKKYPAPITHLVTSLTQIIHPVIIFNKLKLQLSPWNFVKEFNDYICHYKKKFNYDIKEIGEIISKWYAYPSIYNRQVIKKYVIELAATNYCYAFQYSIPYCLFVFLF